MVEEAARPACTVKPRTPLVLPPGLPVERMRLIRMLSSKWVNGTILHYWFLDGPAAQLQAVRDAFAEWKALGIGLVFTEVQDRSEAEIRIGFDQADGSWSYVGRDVLGVPATEPTMNFGWDLTTPYGHTTALHEIGHTLGLPHEHQNPFAGIVWDEQKVYDYFGGSPNFWPREQTFSNVLRKLDPIEVEGSIWDPDSVMEYWFPAGLIIQPAQYHAGLEPAGGLSPTDKEWILRFYPKLKATNPPLTPFVSVPLSLLPGGQANFSIVPSETRKYDLATFGYADTVVVLFEEVKGKLRHLAANDNSGRDRNAKVQVKLFKDRKYVVRVRLSWAGASGQTAIMLW